MILLVDNYDSFTYNIFQYYRVLKQEVTVLRNDEVDVETVSRLGPELIVLSPGPGNPETTGNCRVIVERFSGSIQILGICLGMQTIASVFGGKVVRAPEPAHGKNALIEHVGTGLFEGLSSPLTVTRYHSLVVERKSLPACFEVTAETSDGLVMGLRHRSLGLEGVQFHPEAYLTESGLDMLRNSLPKGIL